MENNHLTDIKDLYSDNNSLTLCWTGNAGWLLSFDKHLVAIDLDLLSERLWDFPLAIDELAAMLEFVFITHDHDDHFNTDTAKYLVDQGSSMFVLPHSCSARVKETGIPDSRIIWTKPYVELKLTDWLRFATSRALHGHLKHSVYSKANFADCGYLLTIGTKRLFHPGDTVLLQEHLTIKDIDLLFVSATEHNTHIEGSVTLIESIKPSKIIAQHFGTYPVTEKNAFWTTGYEEDLKKALTVEYRQRYTIPKPGEIYRID